EGALDEADAPGQLAPHILVEGGARVLFHGVVDDLGEVLVVPVAPRGADECESGGEESAVGEIVDGEHELAAGEVAGDAEDDEGAGAGEAAEAPIPVFAQGVGVRSECDKAHALLCSAARMTRSRSEALPSLSVTTG